MDFLKKYGHFLFIILSSIGYFYIAYFFKRTDFETLILIYSILFLNSYILIKKQISFPILIGLAIFFRLIFLVAIPNLSQDFYRFIWDGRMILEGLNPYLYLPQNFITEGVLPINQAVELYQGMGGLNGSHYTNYPPLNQVSFFLAAIFSNTSILGAVVTMRLQLILADIGILYFGMKILKKMNLSRYLIFWYLLNPFIIIELTGNLHFEALMLFFFVWSVYLFQQNNWKIGAIVLACAISVKLIPLIFLPLFYQWFVKSNENSKVNYFKGIQQLILFFGVVFTTIFLSFLPFYSSLLVDNYFNSVGLWFNNFEFNASFYYLFREIGYLFRGWNEIAIIGKIIPVLTVIFVLIITFFRKNRSLQELLTAMLFVLSFYYFVSTTLHPWYLASLVILCVFTKYKFPIVWSFVVVLSYAAYQNETFKENYYLLILEYVLVYGMLIFELFRFYKINSHNSRIGGIFPIKAFFISKQGSRE